MRLYIKQVLYEMSCHNAFSVVSQIVKKTIIFISYDNHSTLMRH